MGLDKFEFDQQCKFAEGEVKEPETSGDKLICDLSEGMERRTMEFNNNKDRVWVDTEDTEAVLRDVTKAFSMDDGLQVKNKDGELIKVKNEEGVRGER